MLNRRFVEDLELTWFFQQMIPLPRQLPLSHSKVLVDSHNSIPPFLPTQRKVTTPFVMLTIRRPTHGTNGQWPTNWTLKTSDELLHTHTDIYLFSNFYGAR